MTPNPLFLHFHVPKTGGQTIRYALTDLLTPGETFLHLGPWGRQQGYSPFSNDGIAEQSLEFRDRVRAVVGHEVDMRTRQLFAQREVWDFTVLRDPASRMVSHFNFHRSMRVRRGQDPIDFDDWYAQQPTNVVSTFLRRRFDLTTNQSDELITRLASLEFVGDTSTMDQWLPLLLARMDLPATPRPRANVTGVHHDRLLTLDHDLRERIENDHPLDVEMYEIAIHEWIPRSLDQLKSQTGTARCSINP